MILQYYTIVERKLFNYNITVYTTCAPDEIRIDNETNIVGYVAVRKIRLEQLEMYAIGGIA